MLKSTIKTNLHEHRAFITRLKPLLTSKQESSDQKASLISASDFFGQMKPGWTDENKFESE